MWKVAVRSLSNTSRRFSIPTYNVAIIGTGPAGFYTAHHLLRKSSPQDQFRLNVDFFDKNPVPFGLSRYGVAPDHPEVKNCEDYLKDLMNDFPTNSSPSSAEEDPHHRVRFYGNVCIGKDVSLKELENNYHSIILAYGCTNSDNKLNIDGSDLKGIISARQFVNWYNGHVDYHGASAEKTFIPPQLDQVEDVSIIGNGNVALDVARVLLADPESHWKNTDISLDAVEMLKKSKIKRVNIVARRGLLESAFSNKEIRELLELSKDGLFFVPVEEEILREIRSVEKTLPRIDKRKFQILDKYSKKSRDMDASEVGGSVETSHKSWALRYLRSPVEFEGEDGRVTETKVRINNLAQDSLTKAVRVIPTEEYETIKNELVILSIGYQGTPLTGFEELDISFDKNRILNQEGRILSSKASSGEDSYNLVYKPGWYTSGWIKNGPKGVIATTMMESFETAESVLEDLSNKVTTIGDETGKNGLNLEGSNVISWDEWKKIDQYELEQGNELGRTRLKVEDRKKVLQIGKK